jgi:hypothetical protein
MEETLALIASNAHATDECLKSGKINRAVILIDFKMKAEPIYFRETQTEHFGKRGMTWHGILV